ncbi:hypothetical protein KF707_01535 [Candidatus Obscuribacterales bacterium]|nr:hypothetical protein [Candidatus Obscuribacterales bacterium]MBX3134887.1 hypothetical protein [Candidatus Obscuribacterales bacterium]MBX3153975.1 hypothetical protein [Candidatus Obscuribacterales bacterium]
MMTKHLTNSTKAKTSFTILSMCIAMLLSGCDVVKQLVGSGANAPANPGAQAPQQQPATHGPMDGYWKLAFQFNEDVKSSHIRVSQIGDKFSGQGTDDETGKPFLVENGVVRQDEVVFYKRYEQPDNPNQPPVEYGGKVDFKSGYMSGKYLITFQGKEIAGDWEAQREGAEEQSAANNPPPQEQKAPPPANQPNKAPDLSGKWTMGFEYQFKTMHSTMFIEQLGDKITGHGEDENTKEKFVIEKGWYKYPKVTLIRKYAAIKGKNPKPERHMTFKADVSWVNDSDYQGPYMAGKTDGGGNWEAQLVR